MGRDTADIHIRGHLGDISFDGGSAITVASVERIHSSPKALSLRQGTLPWLGFTTSGSPLLDPVGIAAQPTHKQSFELHREEPKSPATDCCQKTKSLLVMELVQ